MTALALAHRRLLVAPPLLSEGEALFCLSCGEDGHACLADPALLGLPLPHPARLVLQRRGGAVWCHLLPGDPLPPFTTPYGPLCGGCGCARRAACPDGCWWTHRPRTFHLGHGHTFTLSLCSRCARPGGLTGD